MTAEEYLAIEMPAEFKSHLIDGVMIPREHSSRYHARITSNLSYEVGWPLKSTKYETMSIDMRVMVPPTGLYTYPDLLVTARPYEFDPLNNETLTNPIVVFEVVSPTTYKLDRVTKLRHYMKLPSVQEIVLVYEDEPVIETFGRRADASWNFKSFVGLADELELSSVPVRVPMSNVYRDVFPKDESESDLELSEPIHLSS